MSEIEDLKRVIGCFGNALGNLLRDDEGIIVMVKDIDDKFLVHYDGTKVKLNILDKDDVLSSMSVGQRVEVRKN